MKKLIFIQLVVLATFVISSQAANKEYCMHLTNFCDTVEVVTSGDLAYGGWDWLCFSDWSYNSIIGNITGARELATRPYWASEGLATYTLQFSIKPDYLFDLVGTDGTYVLFVQSNQPYTLTPGRCTANDVDQSKPSLMSSRVAKNPPRATSQAAPHCMHFQNFCDTISLNQGSGDFAGYAYGNWDWECTGDWVTTSIMGNAKPKYELATRPTYPDGYDASFYTTQFSFKTGRLFDLYATSGLNNLLTYRSNEPYNITSGACSQRDIEKSKPRLLDR